MAGAGTEERADRSWCLMVINSQFYEMKRVLGMWLQSPSAVILEPSKIKSATVSTVSPSISHEL